MTPSYSFLHWRKRPGAHPAPPKTADPPKILLQLSPTLPPTPPSCPEPFSSRGCRTLQPTFRLLTSPGSRPTAPVCPGNGAGGTKALADQQALAFLFLDHFLNCTPCASTTETCSRGTDREDRTGSDVGTSPVSEPACRSGSVLPTGTNTSSPQPSAARGPLSSISVALMEGCTSLGGAPAPTSVLQGGTSSFSPPKDIPPSAHPSRQQRGGRQAPVPPANSPALPAAATQAAEPCLT